MSKIILYPSLKMETLFISRYGKVTFFPLTLARIFCNREILRSCSYNLIVIVRVQLTARESLASFVILTEKVELEGV